MHRFSDEGGLVVRHNKADDDLEGKPDVADAFNVEERRVRFFSLVLYTPSGRPSGPRLVGSRC